MRLYSHGTHSRVTYMALTICGHHWRIGGGRAGHIPPYGTQFFHFRIFAEKCPCRRSTHSPNGSTPPYGKSWISHWSWSVNVSVLKTTVNCSALNFFLEFKGMANEAHLCRGRNAFCGADIDARNPLQSNEIVSLD